jgi:hypothetical protein
MKQPGVAGGPLGVARVDRGRRPSRDAQRAGKSLSAAVTVAAGVLAGVALVEATAVASFGFAAGTAVAVMAALVIGIAVVALRGP